jgi:iron uptake system component EfeO
VPVALTVVLTVALVASCSNDPGESRALAGTPAAAQTSTTVQVSLSHCGQGWAGGAAGGQSFQLQDTDSRAGEVTLVDPGNGAVYAALEPLAAGRTASMIVTLRAGSYAFHCAMEDEDVVSGPTVTVTGSDSAGSAAAPVQPVTQQDLIGPTRAYTAYVTRRLPSLARDVSRMAHDLRRGHRAAAERDWLVAHLAYERLGAAYGAFGDADAAINGLPSGLPKGTQDSDFTGFHRIEIGLWQHQKTSTLVGPAMFLVRQVGLLRTHFRSAQIDPLEVSIRAHEISENALEFELTGRTDFGSHSSLATVRANIDGTRAVLAVLEPLLRTRYAGLPAAQTALTKAATDLDRWHHGHGTAGWTPLLSLPRSAREQLDSDISELTELLAPVAAICEPRRTT